jgi:hypothetical protein
MKITVTQRIECDGHVEEYTASADMADTGDMADTVGVLLYNETIELEREVAKIAKELFESLP